MRLNKSLIIILTIAIPLSLIMLFASQLEAAANHGEKLMPPNVLSDQGLVEANRIGTDDKKETRSEIGMESTIVEMGREILLYIGLNQTATITADLSINKTGVGANAIAGSTYDYNLTVTNEGPDASSGGSVIDDLPTGWTFISASGGNCNSTSSGFTCTVGALSVGTFQPINATVRVPAGASAGQVTNTATVFGNDDPDPGNDTNDIDSATTNITVSADLSLSKTNVGGTAVAGGTHVYMLTVTNIGPSNSSGGSLSDTLPPGWTFSSANGGSCSGTTGGFTCTVDPLAAGASQTFTVTVTIPAGAQAGQVTNTATVSGNEDTNPGNDTDNATTTVTTSADLSLSKTGVGPNAVAGNTYNYVLTVINNGFSNSSGGSISDTLPVGWTFISAAGGICSGTTGGFTCTVNPLAFGASQSFTATVTVPTDAPPGQVTNTATVSGNEDTNPTNDTATAITTVTTSADLSILKQGQPDPVIAGQRLTYTLAVQNNGPSIATGVVVTDDLPLGVNLVSATSTLGTCGTVDPVVCNIGVVNASTNVTVTIAVDVDPFTLGVLVNSATVSGDQGDPNLANNTATRQTGVNRLGQLLLSMDDNPDVVAAGTNLAYAISITNSGPSGATNVVMTDTLPSEVNFVSVQTSPGDNCSESLGVLNCNFGNMTAGESASVDINVFVPPSTFFGQIANEAVASGDAISPSTVVETTDVVSQADLSLTKTENLDPVTAGEDLIYTLEVNNPAGGPSDVQGVVIHDTLPAGVTFQSGSPGCSANGLFVTCDIGTVSVGETVQATITVNVNQDTTGSLANTATVLGQVLEDPNLDNNTDVEMTAVETKADLAIAKSSTPDIVEVDGTVTYTLAIDNNGPSLAANVEVEDNLPPGVTLLSATPSQGICSGTSTVTCELGNLNANDDASVTLVVSLVGLPPGLLENTADVTSDTTDPVSGNDSATSTTLVFDPVFRLFMPIFTDVRFFGEPNDTCETAAPLTLNTIHSFLPEDRDDWYQFDLPSNGNLVVELSNFVPQDGQLTVYYAPDCDSRDQSDVIGINGSSATTKVLNLGNQPAGHYFIYVSNDAAPSTTPYALEVQFIP